MNVNGPHSVSFSEGSTVSFTFGGNVAHVFSKESGCNLEL